MRKWLAEENHHYIFPPSGLLSRFTCLRLKFLVNVSFTDFERITTSFEFVNIAKNLILKSGTFKFNVKSKLLKYILQFRSY